MKYKKMKHRKMFNFSLIKSKKLALEKIKLVGADGKAE